MQTEAVGSVELAVVAGDVLALRGAGLAAPETWALLCQAAQALQDLFLSNGGVVGGSGLGPVVTPHTLELTPRGRVTLQLASPETARAYLPPEYRPGRLYSDTDSEKMWMYSLGRALLDTTPRVAALTGSVSVSPSSALQSVLAAMTEPDPRRRASLMNLLDVISEYCRTRLQSKPFTHIVMDMYREVVRSPQYGARKRAAFPALRAVTAATQRHQRQNQHQAQSQQQSQHSQHPKQHQLQHQHTGHFSKHQVKGALFKAQSRNSRSHPNLLSLSGQEPTLSSPKPQFQSQIDIQTGNVQQPIIHHARTSSQPEYSERVQRGLTGTRSTHNLMFSNNQRAPQVQQANVYSDPIYALPVKPFLSSQDVRVNGLPAQPSVQRTDFYGTAAGRPRVIQNGGSSQPNIAHLTRASNGDGLPGNTEDIRGKGSVGRNTHPITAQSLHRQYSNPQLPTRNLESNGGLRHYSQHNGSALPSRLRIFNGDNEINDGHQRSTEINPVSSMKVQSLNGPVPPKPPRVMTTLKRSAAALPESTSGLSESVAPVKPPRMAIKNGPRARRGKPVQRAPSRLYRAIGGPTRCFDKTQCVGPEFVIRANQPPKILCVGDTKANSSARIVVILLTGQRIEVTCDPQKITAGELFQAIVQAEGLDENFTLGLAALLAGDFAMLPPETKLNKVSPPGWLNTGKSKGTLGLPTSFMLYLRFRFFLPSLRGVRSWISKHLLYLQIRRCILEQQLVCPLAQLVNLTGLALQAEFGNYSVNEHGRGDYFLLEHYIPESLILNPDLHLQQSPLSGGAEALRAQLHQAHRDRRGLDANNAEEMFITHAQALRDYGSHYYIATVDNKELEKIVARLKKCNANRSPPTTNEALYACTENIYQVDATSDCPIYGKIEFNHIDSCDNIQRSVYTDEQKIHVLTKGASDDIYAFPTTPSAINLVEANNNSNNSSNNNNNKLNKSKKSESNVWLAIHAQGLKLFERGGRPRDRTELARLQWRDIQTLSYSKSSLVVYTRFNGKRCKFKLRMDHKKSYYAFKLTSLHHQFYLKLRSELTSLHGLTKDFGIPLIVDSSSPPIKLKSDVSKTKLQNNKGSPNSKYPMGLEEYQNKENENPQKITILPQKCEDTDTEPVCYTPEEDALYAQVNARLEPEGASRDTEDESDRALGSRNGHITTVEISQPQRISEEDKLYSYPSIGLPSEKESLYSIPKPMSSSDVDRLNGELKHPEELYAAINKTGQNKKNSEYPVPEEVWDVANSKKSLHKVKTSSLPNYGTPRQSTGFRTPSLPRRLGVKMGTRAIYSSLVQRDSSLADDLESLSLKSDTASSIRSTSAQSTESPMPEAYVLNADIRTDDETFRIGNDDTMSASLAARLEELSFAEERILQTIQLERGHGGSIGLQVTEGNDGGVYVQAVSVGGSADMAGNVNKGDRIVAINGQSLLNLRYEEALKMLQSSSETVELVLSQITNRHLNLRQNPLQEPVESNYLHNLRFEISSEADTSSMTTKWLSHRATDLASVQNTSSAYSSAASSAMGNHNPNSIYLTDVAATNALNSASMLLSMEDFDVSRTSLESEAPPPVPPRRRKRNGASTKPIIAPRTIKEEHKSLVRVAASRPERKPRSLPPPPPVPQSVPRERKPRAANNTHSCATVTNNSNSAKLEPSGLSLNSKPLPEVFTDAKKSPRFIVTEVTAAKSESESLKVENDGTNFRANANLEYRNENLSGRSSPMPKNCSPLFFTLEDFESVMAHSGISDRSVNEQYDSITTTDTSGPASISSLVENSRVDEQDEQDEYDEQVCFRVTTTNVPFEKSLGGWSLAIDGEDFVSNCDSPDNFIFEDYMDRSKRLNARPTFLFDDDTFDNFGREDSAGPKRRTATKVRFVIESPSSSTPDPDLENTCDSLRNIDSIVIDDESVNDNRKTSVIITEIIETNETISRNDNAQQMPSSDEFGEVPFSSLLDSEINNERNSVSHCNINLDSSASTLENNKDEVANNAEPCVELETMDLKYQKNHHTPRSTPSPRFRRPREVEFDPIPTIDDELVPKLPITFDPREEGFVKKDVDLSRFEGDGRKTAREAFVTGNFKADSRENRNFHFTLDDNSSDADASVAKPSVTNKKKIFIDSTLRDFIDNDDDMDWNDQSDEEEGKDDPNVAGGSTPLSVNDRTVEEFGNGFGQVLNRDTCHFKEVSLDKNPRSQQAPPSDKDNNQERFANEDDLKNDSSSTADSRGHCLINTSSCSMENKDEMNWVPVNVRRNSFLENMLAEDGTRQSFGRNVPCSIIAAHPKPAFPRASPRSTANANIPRELVEETETSLFRDVDKSRDVATAVTVRRESNESLQKQLRNETGVRIVGTPPGGGECVASGVEKEKKSTGEAKSDVLSELLCNFGAIKLKSVEPYKRDTDLSELDDKAAIETKIGNEKVVKEAEIVARIGTENVLGVESSGDKKTDTKSVTTVEPAQTRSTEASAEIVMTKPKTMKSFDIETSSLTSCANRGSEKTDDPRVDDKSVNIILSQCTKSNDVKLRRGEDNAESLNFDMSLVKCIDDDAVISVDKCAIDRKINPLIRRNNNDNNAMTPVDISNDQKSCDADVKIAPGSVRSFVELYEIQRDQTSKHSKSNYSLPVAKKLTTARCCKGLINDDVEDEPEFIGDENIEGSKGAAKGIENVADQEKTNHARCEIPARESCVDRVDSREKDVGGQQNAIARNIVAHNGDISQGKDGFSCTNDFSYVQYRQQTSGAVPVAAKRRSQESCLRISAELSPRSEAKKTVTFNSDCEVIKTLDNAPGELPLVEPASSDGGARPKTKRRAPGKPAAMEETDQRDCATESIVELNQGINPTAEKLARQENVTASPTPTPRSEVNSLRTQIQQGIEDDKDGTIKTGIAPSVPKSDVPRLRQPYVFYCRL